MRALLALLVGLAPLPIPSWPVSPATPSVCRTFAINSTSGQVTPIAFTPRNGSAFSITITATPGGDDWSEAGIHGLFSSGDGADNVNAMLYNGGVFMTTTDHTGAWKTYYCNIAGTGPKTLSFVVDGGAMAIYSGGVVLSSCSSDGVGTGVITTPPTTLYVGRRGVGEEWAGTIASVVQCRIAKVPP